MGRSGASTRTYRVSRVLAVRTTDEPFERPKDVDLAQYWSESLLAYEATRSRVEVTILVAEEDLDGVADVVGLRTIRDSRRGPDPAGAGQVRLTLPFDWKDEAEAAVFRLGHLVEVVEPAALRDQLIEQAQAVLGRYGANGVGLESRQAAMTG